MKFHTVPGIDRPISQLVLGTMIFDPERMDQVECLMDAFLAVGGNCLDTAFVYNGGRSEQAIGRWLAAHPREAIVIIDKGAHPRSDGRPRVTPEAIEADLSESLDRLGIRCIDLYLLHRDDPSVPVGPIVEALHDQRVRGRIRAFGGSNWTVPRIQAANAYAIERGLTPFVASSPHLSLARPIRPRWPGCVNASDEDLRWHRDQQFPLFAWSSQAGGFFTGRFSPGVRDEGGITDTYDTVDNWERLRRARDSGVQRGLNANQMALAYVLNQPFPAFALIGPHSTDELRQSAAAIGVSLTKDEMAWLERGDE